MRIGASKFFECSAKNNQGISEIFEYAAKVPIQEKNQKQKKKQKQKHKHIRCCIM